MSTNAQSNRTEAAQTEKFVRPLKMIALFGGANEISKAAAHFITKHNPDVALRLLVRREEARDELKSVFPNADIRIADYFDKESLVNGLAGVDAVFVITPDFFDETAAMTNFAEAAKAADVQHVIRLTGDPPGKTIDRVPDFIKRAGNVPSIQHLYARAVLDASKLPVTYLNSAAFFMHTLTTPLVSYAIKKDRVLAMPFDRKMTFVDKVDIGECAATLLLSNDRRHIGASYHLNNGHDLLYFKDIAAMLSDILQEEVRYDDSEEAFRKYNADGLKALLKNPEADTLILEMFKFEKAHEHAWRRSDIVEYLLGRPAKKLRDWLKANVKEFVRV